ncbi:transcriptional activator protein DAL81 [Pseudohyphozyma bogoriensis]|nr:transcriptional activator protein DAL81 [Pseudohyphozyma bogoriensis]
MLRLLKSTVCVLAVGAVAANAYAGRDPLVPNSHQGLAINGIPAATREYWMREAIKAVEEVTGDPCPPAPAGCVIVLHTNEGDTELCRGANIVYQTGDPTLHGESVAIRNCVEKFTSEGKSAAEILAIWREASLYSTHEPCTMCMSTIRFGGFKEMIFGSSVKQVHLEGRSQIAMSSHQILEKSYAVGMHQTTIIPGILEDEVLPHFRHQHSQSSLCPAAGESLKNLYLQMRALRVRMPCLECRQTGKPCTFLAPAPERRPRDLKRGPPPYPPSRSPPDQVVTNQSSSLSAILHPSLRPADGDPAPEPASAIVAAPPAKKARLEEPVRPVLAQRGLGSGWRFSIDEDCPEKTEPCSITTMLTDDLLPVRSLIRPGAQNEETIGHRQVSKNPRQPIFVVLTKKPTHRSLIGDFERLALRNVRSLLSLLPADQAFDEARAYDLYLSHNHSAFPILPTDPRPTLDALSPAVLALVLATSLLHDETTRQLSPATWDSIKQARVADHCLEQPKLSAIAAALLEMGARPVMDPRNDYLVLAKVGMVAQAQLLGLHLDCSNWVLPDWEKSLRARLFWAIKIHDACLIRLSLAAVSSASTASFDSAAYPTLQPVTLLRRLCANIKASKANHNWEVAEWSLIRATNVAARLRHASTSTPATSSTAGHQDIVRALEGNLSPAFPEPVVSAGGGEDHVAFNPLSGSLFEFDVATGVGADFGGDYGWLTDLGGSFDWTFGNQSLAGGYEGPSVMLDDEVAGWTGSDSW